MPFLTELDVRVRRTRGRVLLADLCYQGKDDCFTVPAGYVTDFATSPKFIRWLVDDDDETYVRAAVVHDWLITDEIPARRVTSRDADGIFRRIMREEGVSKPMRSVMWAAVRVASLFSPHRSYGRQFLRDAPLVVPVGILAGVVLAPASLLVLLTRFLLAPLRYLK